MWFRVYLYKMAASNAGSGDVGNLMRFFNYNSGKNDDTIIAMIEKSITSMPILIKPDKHDISNTIFCMNKNIVMYVCLRFESRIVMDINTNKANIGHDYSILESKDFTVTGIQPYDIRIRSKKIARADFDKLCDEASKSLDMCLTKLDGDTEIIVRISIDNSKEFDSILSGTDAKPGRYMLFKLNMEIYKILRNESRNITGTNNAAVTYVKDISIAKNIVNDYYGVTTYLYDKYKSIPLKVSTVFRSWLNGRISKDSLVDIYTGVIYMGSNDADFIRSMLGPNNNGIYSLDIFSIFDDDDRITESMVKRRSGWLHDILKIMGCAYKSNNTKESLYEFVLENYKNYIGRNPAFRLIKEVNNDDVITLKLDLAFTDITAPYDRVNVEDITSMTLTSKFPSMAKYGAFSAKGFSREYATSIRNELGVKVTGTLKTLGITGNFNLTTPDTRRGEHRGNTPYIFWFYRHIDPMNWKIYVMLYTLMGMIPFMRDDGTTDKVFVSFDEHKVSKATVSELSGLKYLRDKDLRMIPSWDPEYESAKRKVLLAKEHDLAKYNASKDGAKLSVYAAGMNKTHDRQNALDCYSDVAILNGATFTIAELEYIEEIWISSFGTSELWSSGMKRALYMKFIEAYSLEMHKLDDNFHKRIMNLRDYRIAYTLCLERISGILRKGDILIDDTELMNKDPNLGKTYRRYRTLVNYYKDNKYTGSIDGQENRTNKHFYNIFRGDSLSAGFDILCGKTGPSKRGPTIEELRREYIEMSLIPVLTRANVQRFENLGKKLGTDVVGLKSDISADTEHANSLVRVVHSIYPHVTGDISVMIRDYLLKYKDESLHYTRLVIHNGSVIDDWFANYRGKDLDKIPSFKPPIATLPRITKLDKLIGHIVNILPNEQLEDGDIDNLYNRAILYPWDKNLKEFAKPLIYSSAEMIELLTGLCRGIISSIANNSKELEKLRRWKVVSWEDTKRDTDEIRKRAEDSINKTILGILQISTETDIRKILLSPKITYSMYIFLCVKYRAGRYGFEEYSERYPNISISYYNYNKLYKKFSDIFNKDGDILSYIEDRDNVNYEDHRTLYEDFLKRLPISLIEFNDMRSSYNTYLIESAVVHQSMANLMKVSVDPKIAAKEEELRKRLKELRKNLDRDKHDVDEEDTMTQIGRIEQRLVLSASNTGRIDSKSEEKLIELDIGRESIESKFIRAFDLIYESYTYNSLGIYACENDIEDLKSFIDRMKAALASPNVLNMADTKVRDIYNKTLGIDKKSAEGKRIIKEARSSFIAYALRTDTNVVVDDELQQLIISRKTKPNSMSDLEKSLKDKKIRFTEEIKEVNGRFIGGLRDTILEYCKSDKNYRTIIEDENTRAYATYWREKFKDRDPAINLECGYDPTTIGTPGTLSYFVCNNISKLVYISLCLENRYYREIYTIRPSFTQSDDDNFETHDLSEKRDSTIPRRIIELSKTKEMEFYDSEINY